MVLLIRMWDGNYKEWQCGYSLGHTNSQLSKSYLAIVYVYDGVVNTYEIDVNWNDSVVNIWEHQKCTCMLQLLIDMLQLLKRMLQWLICMMYWLIGMTIWLISENTSEPIVQLYVVNVNWYVSVINVYASMVNMYVPVVNQDDNVLWGDDILVFLQHLTMQCSAW